MGASRWIGHRNDFLAATANVIFVFDCHCLYAPLKYDVIYHHTLRKKSAFIFPFWTQISYCNRESSVVQCKSIYDKVQRPVLLSSRRTPSCRSVSFLFLIMCYCLKNSRGLHPKAPFKICAVRFTLARGVCNSLYVTSFFQQNLWSLPTLDRVENLRLTAMVDVKCI